MNDSNYNSTAGWIGSDGARPSAHQVRSSDGVGISYFTIGRGPGVVAIPGALSTASDYAVFAAALGQTHSVHVIERRGRGMSGPQGADYGIETECADVMAVMRATGSTLIFGHSFGGLVALETALRAPEARKVVVYEPGVSVGGAIATSWLEPCQQRLERGRTLEAFAAFSIAAGPRQGRRMPVWLMKMLLPFVVDRAHLAKRVSLLSTTLPEHRVIGELDGTHSRYSALTADVLLLSGDKRPLDWVGPAIRVLRNTLPSVTSYAFEGLDHFGPDQSGPNEVAKMASTYFLSQSTSG
jgi:pimeloyl-ACP methyl ester carboxylesterase